MSANFKHINSREVVNIGYSPEFKICRIEYNHFKDKSGNSYYYEDVSQEEFDKLKVSTSVALDAEEMFNNKTYKINHGLQHS